MITYHLLSNQGDRGNNEDNVGMYQREQEYCFVLADGLGGHGKGELASQLGVESAVKIFAVKGAGQESMELSFQDAQKMILEKQAVDITARDMKTTLVILHLGEKRFGGVISGTAVFIISKMASLSQGLWITVFLKCWWRRGS